MQKETEHFEFYCPDENVSDIDVLSEELESQYKSISSHLKTKLPEKAEIIIYPDMDSLHNVISQQENIPKNEIADWVAVTGYKNSINILSPLNTEYKRNLTENTKLQAKLTLTEIIIKNINKNAPSLKMM